MPIWGLVTCITGGGSRAPLSFAIGRRPSGRGPTVSESGGDRKMAAVSRPCLRRRGRSIVMNVGQPRVPGNGHRPPGARDAARLSVTHRLRLCHRSFRLHRPGSLAYSACSPRQGLAPQSYARRGVTGGTTDQRTFGPWVITRGCSRGFLGMSRLRPCGAPSSVCTRPQALPRFLVGFLFPQVIPPIISP